MPDLLHSPEEYPAHALRRDDVLVDLDEVVTAVDHLGPIARLGSVVVVHTDAGSEVELSPLSLVAVRRPI